MFVTNPSIILRFGKLTISMIGEQNSLCFLNFLVFQKYSCSC